MSRVLITGGAGFIGLHLARKLLDEDLRVDLVDDFSRGRRDAELEALNRHDRVTLIARDLTRDDSLADLDRNYEMIFHLAAIVGVERVVEAPYEVLTRNMEMLSRLLDFARDQAHLHRFLFASTSEVYAGSQDLPGFTVPTLESVPIKLPDLGEPRASYLLSKLYGEALCRHSGVPVTILRPHNIYGSRMGRAHVIPQLLERARRGSGGEDLEVYSPGHTRAFCHVSDAVEMMARLAFGQLAAGGTFNIGNQTEEIAMRELARRILALCGRTGGIEEGPDTPGSPARRCPDMAKTRAATQFEPLVALEDGLRETAQWYRASDAVGVAAA